MTFTNTNEFPAQCRVCAAPMPQGSDRCSRCKTLHAEFRRCEHCGGLTEVIEVNGVYVCNACSKPRIPMERSGISRSGREREALQKVGVARKREITLKFATFGTIALMLPLTLVLLIAFLASFTALTITFALVDVMVLVAAILLYRSSKKAHYDARNSMLDALGSAALDVMRAKGPITSQQLADQMGISQDNAEKALERLPARSDVRVDIDMIGAEQDGLVRYRIADPLRELQAQETMLAEFDVNENQPRLQVQKLN